MNKLKTNDLEQEEEIFEKKDYSSLITGYDQLDVNKALEFKAKSLNKRNDGSYREGFCYYENKEIYYCRKKGETLSFIASLFNIKKEYVYYLNDIKPIPYATQLGDLISLGSIQNLQKESSSDFPLSSQGNIFSYMEIEYQKQDFHNDTQQLYNSFLVSKFTDHSSKTAKKPENLAPEEAEKQYSPQDLSDRFHKLFPGEKDNQKISQSQIEFAFYISSRIYVIFTISGSAGVGVTGSVTDDRRFTTSLNWNLGMSGGVDFGIASAEIGAEIGGSLSLFDQLNGSYESINHFLAHFHNNLRILVDKAELDPADYGLDDNSTYWQTNKSELGKPYTMVKKVYGALKGKGGVGLDADDKLSAEGKVATTFIERKKRAGIKTIGKSNPEASQDVDTEFLKDINDTDLVYEHTKSFELNLPIYGGTKVAIETLDVYNDANKDNNGAYINLQIEVPLGKAEATNKKNKIDGLIGGIKNNKEQVRQAISSIKGGLGSLGELTTTLGRAFIPVFVHGKEAGISKNKSISATTSLIMEINAVQEDFSAIGYNIQYVRFWSSNTLSAGSDNKKSSTDKAKKVALELNANSKYAFSEFLFGNTLSYICTVYNQMMWEARDTTSENELLKLLKSSKVKRLSQKDSYLEYDQQILEKLEALYDNDPFEYSCSDWDKYYSKHSSGIDGIKNSFVKEFNKHWVRLMKNEDRMPRTIMGFDIWRHLGNSKEKITANLPNSEFQINPMNKTKSLLKLSKESFFKYILFKNYLENRTYASDYWK
ncbi:hypothetical protein [Flammeovirga sp. SJP92]|uniref:hypothetical protein n=1 Tax=Flammeovirga sp. SJP92 TaxID=1775430 RepID=UPI000793BBC1|nr:hypothetical protein [Flammeovirga sp. SJP92]KXX68550.1 hypothetical protein AVL50_22575 [Flammeovirga sp. SJP92]